MRNYALKRLFWVIPTILLSSITLFLATTLMPGDYVDSMIERMIERDPLATLDMDRDEIAKQLGLDRPIYEQYLNWLGDVVLHGELGKSMITGRSTMTEMIKRAPVTIELNILTFILTWMVAIPVGIYSALRQDTALDYLGRGFSLLGMAVPDFWLASLLIVFAGMWWGWFPEVVYIPFIQDPIGNLKQFIIPALILSVTGAGGLVRTLRAFTLEVLRQDYVRTAWAKGLTQRAIIFRHALRNAMIPLNSMIIPMVLGLLGGSVMMENIFAIPGMGRFLISALTSRDYPVMLGTNVFFTSIGLITIVIVDLSYAWADPRIRYR